MIGKPLSIVKRLGNLTPYLFVAPFFIIFTIFSIFPVGYTLYTSFFEWNGFDTMRGVGLGNYLALASDPFFKTSVLNTLRIMLVILPLEVIIALLVAHLLDTYFVKAKHYFETIFFLPYLTSPVAVGILFAVIFGYKYGLFNWVLNAMGITNRPIDWIGDPTYAIAMISFVVLWKAVGYTVIVFVAGMQTISAELYESAKIDGARASTVFFRITIPLLKPVIVFIIITTIIGDLQLFAEPFMLYGGGGTRNSALTIVTYLYQSAFQFGKSGYGAAISFVLFFLILFVSQVVYKLITRGDDRE